MGARCICNLTEAQKTYLFYSLAHCDCSFQKNVCLKQMVFNGNVGNDDNGETSWLKKLGPQYSTLGPWTCGR